MKHAVLTLAFLAFAPLALAHGGGLDRNGCHTNRKTGDYHCHGGGSAPAPAPARSASASPSPEPKLVSAQVAQPAATTGRQDLVRAAQLLLDALGYRPSLMGALDARTTAAIRSFQRNEGLDPNGTVTEFLVVRLAEKAAARCR